jgi:hypothetical protein
LQRKLLIERRVYIEYRYAAIRAGKMGQAGTRCPVVAALRRNRSLWGGGGQSSVRDSLLIPCSTFAGDRAVPLKVKKNQQITA